MTDLFVAGVDGCPGGWVSLQVNTVSRATCVRLADLPAILRNRPPDLEVLAIDIPIGLLSGCRACDRAARKLLGPFRGRSVFPTACRAALQAQNYREACEVNRQRSGRGMSRQAWCIGPKIKEVDDAIASEAQRWVFEVHPEVSFWAMNHQMPMNNRKKSRDGQAERLALLRETFPEIEEHIRRRPAYVGVDDLLDAAAAAWTALRIYEGTAHSVCPPEQDERGLEVAIHY